MIKTPREGGCPASIRVRSENPSRHAQGILYTTLPLSLSLPRANSFFPTLPLSYAESWQHAQSGSTFGYGNLAAGMTFAAAKRRGLQARASLSALHFSVLIGFSISFSTAQRGLVELEKQQRFLSQWCNGKRLQSIFWEHCTQLYYIFRTVWLLCLLKHMKDYKQCYFSEALYSH